MATLKLPDEQDWVINIVDQNGDMVGTVTVDRLEEIHFEASQYAKQHGDSIAECIAGMLNQELSTTKITTVIASALIEYKTNEIAKLKKNIVD